MFINALSWKRLAASHSKKKLENNKNKAANLPTATFRPPLVEAIHPLAIDKNKNIQQQNHQYFTPGAPKLGLALDLVRANNTNKAQPHLDKLTTKLPLSIPLQISHAQHQQHQQQQQQQQHQTVLHPTHTHGPRKTVIQVWHTLPFPYSFISV